MAHAPRVPASTASAATNRKQTNEEDADLERMLANLKS
jgi:hypothetical protein